MTEIKVLIEGYARNVGGIEHASSTTTLIQEKKINIIVDPGMDRKRLLDSLAKEYLAPKDIKYVILTHNHMDHMLLAGIFENAEVLDDSSVYTFDGKIFDHDGFVPGTKVQLMKTPGHDMFHCAVIVKTETLGIVAIASDVFWWRDREEQKLDKESLLSHPDPYVKDKKQLLESRKKILDIADCIIPGHGKMFKIKK